MVFIQSVLSPASRRMNINQNVFSIHCEIAADDDGYVKVNQEIYEGIRRLIAGLNELSVEDYEAAKGKLRTGHIILRRNLCAVLPHQVVANRNLPRSGPISHRPTLILVICCTTWRLAFILLILTKPWTVTKWCPELP